MVCSKCGQSGHNARTCGKRSDDSIKTTPNLDKSTVPNILIELPKILGANVETSTLFNYISPSGISISSDAPPTISIIPHISDIDTPASLITPSEEQQYIIDKIGGGNNVVADCVAGSGKTTTVLFLAQQFPEKRVLQVTYNKDLKLEVREKADMRGISNLEIHTYHSLCVKYYNRMAHTDGPMRTVVERNTPPMCALPAYDIVVLDEVQDMTILYYWIIKKLLRDCSSDHQPLLLILGDRYQAINQFRKADPRFITLSSQIWGRPFVTAKLSTSYRLTNQMAEFVNDIMLRESRIHTVKSGAPVKYVIANTYTDVVRIAKMVSTKLKEGYSPNDIFILAPSIKNSDSPIRKLENKLVEQGIPCYYPTSDDAEIDSKVIAGKVVFCTFHQSKGRERSIVLVYSFDSSYFTFYGRDMNPLICPNILYVAATRAREELIVISSNTKRETNKPLQFLNINHESDLFIRSYICCNVLSGTLRTVERTGDKHKDNSHKTSVTDLTKHLNEQSLSLLNKICNSIFTNISEATCNTPIVSKLSSGKGMYEEVSELNGLIIPGLYERHKKKSSTIERVVLCSSEIERHTLVKKLYSETNIEAPSLTDYTKITVMYYSIVENLLNKIAQIPRYDWLTEDAIAHCHNIMELHIPDHSTYEEDIELDESDDILLFPKYGKLNIKGRMDIVTDTEVFEIKCVQELKVEHKLQLLIYAWLWNVSGRFAALGSRRFKLLNTRTGELWELNVTSPLLREAIEIMIDNKYGDKYEKPDNIFIEECLMR